MSELPNPWSEVAPVLTAAPPYDVSEADTAMPLCTVDGCGRRAVRIVGNDAVCDRCGINADGKTAAGLFQLIGGA